MTEKEQRAAAKKFAENWKDRGYEKGESQSFWIELLRDVFGVQNVSNYFQFEKQVEIYGEQKKFTTKFIDAYIPATKVLIEQKAVNVSLDSYIKDLYIPTGKKGEGVTPYMQAKYYANNLPHNEHPRWIITCNFKTFRIYDQNKINKSYEEILLDDLEKEYYRLKFLINENDEHINKELEVSLKAGEIIGEIYDAFKAEYTTFGSPQSLHSLNVLCVRLVFCLYAEDAGVFGSHNMFHDYLAKYKPGHGDMRRALIDLFQVLNTPQDKRDPYMSEDLLAFPYCNGGLFADEHIEIPRFNDTIATLLLKNASLDFDWSQISPTIFGAVFESTLNPETRRKGGMHYTSVENIHKVIDPLFLDDLEDELNKIRHIQNSKQRTNELKNFKTKLGSLKFFDPACGSGNFLTETYICLRRLENEVLKLITDAHIELDMLTDNLIQVRIHQFYGIEINDFAVATATTAMWIAEAQMMAETESIIHRNLDLLPLKSYHNIIEGNALTIDWNEVIPASQLNYIMGNPPFVGYSLQSQKQKEDLQSIMPDFGKNIDYVAGWYYKCSEYIQGTSIHCALVSTNSITQGEQVAAIWKPLFSKFGIHFDFAYRTFRWDSEASIKAHVHCVIIGFSVAPGNKQKRLYFDGKKYIEAEVINPYLLKAPLVFIESNKHSVSPCPNMTKGSQPTDGGNLFLMADEKKQIELHYPHIAKYIHRFYGATEFINNQERYVFWLLHAAPSDMRSCPPLIDRIKKVRKMRLASTKAATRKQAETAALFTEIRQPETDFLLIPSHSSENRQYIPIGYMNKAAICGNANLMVPNATLYHFGILTSNVHMAWLRAVCGRIKSDYRYSIDIVYNNFPWPTPTEVQRDKIEQTAQAILDARALYPDCSLADLYDEVAMPPELRRAHQQNDRAVMNAYGFPVSNNFTESDCVSKLFEMYKKLTK